MTVLCGPDGALVGELNFPFPLHGRPWRVLLHPPARLTFLGAAQMQESCDIVMWYANVEAGEYDHGDGKRVPAVKFLDQGSLDAWRAWNAAWEAV